MATYVPSYTTLVQGQVVALALQRPVADEACYIGEVQATDARGVRITVTTGLLAGLDYFAPWTNIEGALVATSAEHLNGDELDGFQHEVRRQARRAEHDEPVTVRHYDQG
jgi:hypothetical protein